MSQEQDSQLPEYKKYSRKELIDVVIDTVCNNVGHGLDAHDVSEDSDIIEDLHGDSLDLVGTTIDLDETLCVSMLDEEVGNKYVIRELVDAYYNRLKLEGRIKE